MRCQDSRSLSVTTNIHRDYASPTTIQIRVYDDRIAIWNAVKLPPEWAADQLAGELSSKPYNPRIAYAFFRAGMIEAWGRGIRRIVDMCREAGNPTPEWKLESSGDGLWLRFPFSAAYRAADSPASSAPAPKTTRKAGVSGVEAGDQPESQPESRPESQPESLALRVLKQLADGPMSKTELSSSLGQKKISGQLNKVIRLLVTDGRVAYTIPDKPRSRLQQYRLTDKGRASVERLRTGNAGS